MSYPVVNRIGNGLCYFVIAWGVPTLMQDFVYGLILWWIGLIWILVVVDCAVCIFKHNNRFIHFICLVILSTVALTILLLHPSQYEILDKNYPNSRNFLLFMGWYGIIPILLMGFCCLIIFIIMFCYNYLCFSMRRTIISEQCVVCHDRKPDILFIPCKHVCVCQGCHKQLADHQNKCPLDRCEIDGYIIYSKS